MIDTTLSRLTAISLYEDIADIYESLFKRFEFTNVPLLDIYTQYELSDETRKELFESFPTEVSLFLSSDSFYSSFIFLRYYCGILEHLIDNNIDFTQLTFKAEQLIILNTFKLLRGL